MARGSLQPPTPKTHGWCASSSDSYDEDDADWASYPDNDDFLVETCVTYELALNLSDCLDTLLSLFLPLCSSNESSFNVPALDTSDFTALVTDATFANGTNVESAQGILGPDGTLGLEVVLRDYLNTHTFELCLGNVTVDAQHAANFNITSIGTSHGSLLINSSQTLPDCAIDGLPCFDFFFDAACDEADVATTGCGAP